MFFLTMKQFSKFLFSAITLINKLDKDLAIISCSIFMLPENENHVKSFENTKVQEDIYLFFI